MRQMGRPQKCRFIESPPEFTVFKPEGWRHAKSEQVLLTIDEFEAVRLSDYHGASHEEGAEKMGISRPVFTRLIEAAHKKIAQSIVDGRILVIEGGNVSFRRNCRHCRNATVQCDSCIQTGE